ncbi:MAG: hypothetical protein ACLQK8_09020 [Streptosporangiaceae bacterium]
MKITEGRVRLAASDVANFLACRRLTQLDLLRAGAVLEWFRAGVQKVEPRWMHLARGNGEFASFKVDDFAAYERQTRRLLAAALGGDRRPRCTRSRSSTVPSAGSASCAPTAGETTTTCRWWPE